MRLRQVGPGIGGLNYSPLLRNVRRPPWATSPARLEPTDVPRGARSGASASWQSLVELARRAVERLVESRKAQAARLIAIERQRLFGRNGTSFDRSAIGSRYY